MCNRTELARFGGRRSAGVATVTALGLLLSACGQADVEDPGDAQRLNEPPAAPPPVSADVIPPLLNPEPLWAAPFSTDPKPVGEGFVGLAMPDDDHDDLRFLGVDAGGTTHWSTPRNPSCTAFAATRADGRDLVVLLDSNADTEKGFAATQVIAAAYDPADGAQVWGPVDVPGTLAGPGLIFAETAGSVMDDASGPQVALAAEDGQVVADERESDVDILHEHEGALLTREDGVYRAVDTTTGEELWTSGDLTPPESLSTEAEEARLVYGPRPISDSSPVVVLGWSTAGAEDGDFDIYTVHDLWTGSQLAELDGAEEPAVYAAPDGETSVVSGVRNGTATALAFAGTEPLWDTPEVDDMRLDRIAGDAVYFSDGAATHAFDLATGDERGSGEWRTPNAAAPDGTTLVQVESPGEGDLFVALSQKPAAADPTEGDV